MSTLDLERHVVTVTEAARRTRKTVSRIRQICRQHDIGILITCRLRLLSNADLRKIEKIISKSGKNFANAEN